MGLGSKRISDYLIKSSEPFVFGWKPEALAHDCERHGLKLIETCSSAQCVDRYLTPLGRNLNKAHFFHLAIAEVI